MYSELHVSSVARLNSSIGITNTVYRTTIETISTILTSDRSRSVSGHFSKSYRQKLIKLDPESENLILGYEISCQGHSDMN